ncbi:MAG TPA: PfkB family carbohydrate kinase [Gaiellales bacterium]|nr:PfkB family carbohydrate kinase [Gaiellales bacterium]
MSPRLAVVGHVEWVTFARAAEVPAAGGIVHLADPVDQPGGGGAATALALAGMGADVTLFTALGGDVPAAEVLKAGGVRVLAAHRDHPQTRVLAVVDGGGERTLFVVGENDHPTADDPLPWSHLGGMDGVYFTGRDPRTLVLARQARTLVVTARRFDSLVAGGVSADALVGSGSDPSERFDLARLSRPPAHVIVTDGARGGTVDGRRYAAVPPASAVVDTYAAGDTFVAGVLFGLATGLDIGDTVRFAAAAASAALTRRGCLPEPPAGRPC